MKTASFRIFVRSDFEKVDGTFPIYLRVIINRVVKNYTLGISIPNPEKYWNEKHHMIRKIPSWSAEDVNKANLEISDFFNRASTLIHECKLGQRRLSFEEFREHVFGQQYDKLSFYDFAEKENKLLLEETKSSETFRTNTTFISKLKKFKSELYFSEIDLDFLRRLSHYMKEELKNNENTMFKTISYIKAICNKAKTKKIIKENPVNGFKIKRIVGNRVPLSIDELKKLENLLDKEMAHGLKNVLQYFIFACYTGIRYGDIKKLRFKDIVERIVDNERIKVIQIIMGKTKDPLELPLTNKPLSLIGKGLEYQPVFRVFSDQVTNRHLKVLMTKAGIDKKISFHCSRNTFITISLDIGINYGIMPKLSGHKSMASFWAYYKPPVQTKLREILKFNEI
jgi:integrase